MNYKKAMDSNALAKCFRGLKDRMKILKTNKLWKMIEAPNNEIIMTTNAFSRLKTIKMVTYQDEKQD